APYGAPAILGHQFLHRPIELVGCRKGLLDEFLAEDRLANLHAALEDFLAHLRFSSPWGAWRLDCVSQPRTSTLAHCSTVLHIEVKSESGPKSVLVIPRNCRTALPTMVGTPMASASSRHRLTSL